MSPYLDEALTMEPRAIAALLASLREGNPSVAANLEILLQERQILADESFLERASAAAPGYAAFAGQTVGAYRLQSLIGEGGMGAVWLAERSDGRFERRAALKFLKIALGRGGEERFQREGRILGRLTHPHVAQLLDAGVSTAGQPYLVLEYVDGEPIDRYCDRLMLDVQTRIRLFLDVLDAVAHAHANLIVHRDIKPSNVLVSAEGQVKLLDFGIAKLLEEEGELVGATDITREAGGAMTLLYAAPEQVTGGAVTTAADVYALGVLLYVLLTGSHPAGPGPYSPAELMKHIVDIEPPRLADLFSTYGDSAGRTSQRASTPDKLRRRLRGDLETIAAKALKKNPAERYQGVAALAADLRRYLNDRPIDARPDTISYRARRFLRRNRMAVALAALACTALLAGITATTIEARVANHQRTVAQKRFQQVRELANKVLSLSATMSAVPGATKARHEIVAISKDYLESLAPGARADPDLAKEIGTAYLSLARLQGIPGGPGLGQYAAAEESLRKAEALLDASARGREVELILIEVSEALMQIARSYDSRKQEAIAQARKTASRLDTFLARGKPSAREERRAADIFYSIALVFRNLHLGEEAVTSGRRAVALARSSGAIDLEAFSLSALADLQRISGDLEGALETIRQAHAALERTKSANEIARRNDWFVLLWREGIILGADSLIGLNRSAEGIVSLERAGELIEASAREDPNNASIRIYFAQWGRELGGVLRQRDPRRSLAVYDLGIRRLSEVKNNNRARGGAAGLLAGSSYPLRRLDRTAEARTRIDDAFQLLRETKEYPAERIDPDSEAEPALRALADHHAETGDPQRAIAVYQELLDKIMASKPDPQNDLRHATKISRIYGALADLHARTGQAERAAGMAAQRRELWRHWDRKLPGNAFVRRQLDAADAH